VACNMFVVCTQYSVGNSEFIKFVVHDAYNFSMISNSWWLFVCEPRQVGTVDSFDPSLLPDDLRIFSSHFSKTKLD
jgi:hypothetical protein